MFFSDSGSVSVEVAIKMAIQYWLNRGVRDRHKLIAFRGGYHGDTVATMSVCDPQEGMHSLFAGVLPRHHVVDLPSDEAGHASFERFLSRHAREAAAILVEPLVQGAGGMLFHDASVLARLRRSADRHGLLLILDEVFTGFGRTGTMFACEQAGIVPDIITLSKALTGGTMGLAATVARRHVFEAFWSDDPARALMHGPTFMATPLRLARPVRTRGPAGTGRGHRGPARGRACTLPRLAGRAGRARARRHRRGPDGGDPRSAGARTTARRPGRLGPPFP